MFRVLTAAVAVAAASAVTPAVADGPTFGCRLWSFHQDFVTGQTYEGVMVAYVAHAGGPVTIRCRVTVNGGTAASTDVGSGPGVGVAWKDVSFQAGDDDVFGLCTDYTSEHGSGTTCVTFAPTSFPPQII